MLPDQGAVHRLQDGRVRDRDRTYDRCRRIHAACRRHPHRRRSGHCAADTARGRPLRGRRGQLARGRGQERRGAVEDRAGRMDQRRQGIDQRQRRIENLYQRPRGAHERRTADDISALAQIRRHTEDRGNTAVGRRLRRLVVGRHNQTDAQTTHAVGTYGHRGDIRPHKFQTYQPIAAVLARLQPQQTQPICLGLVQLRQRTDRYRGAYRL